MLHIFVHAACLCPCCISMSSCRLCCLSMFILHVYVYTACTCPCCTAMSILYVYVNVYIAYPCPC
jgi:hypothetical protein